MSDEKRRLYHLGRTLVFEWCEINEVDAPTILESEEPKLFGECAFYRDSVIKICVDACASVGRAGRQWSFPGYTADRTPYGVLAHELGHHVDLAHGARGGTRARQWREETQEKAITGYCPNSNEWFAELFRVFVTNPGLLKEVRPKMFARLHAEWPVAVERRPWREVLAGADRQLAAAEKKIPKRARQAALAGAALG